MLCGGCAGAVCLHDAHQRAERDSDSTDAAAAKSAAARDNRKQDTGGSRDTHTGHTGAHEHTDNLRITSTQMDTHTHGTSTQSQTDTLL